MRTKLQTRAVIEALVRSCDGSLFGRTTIAAQAIRRQTVAIGEIGVEIAGGTAINNGTWGNADAPHQSGNVATIRMTSKTTRHLIASIARDSEWIVRSSP